MERPPEAGSGWAGLAQPPSLQQQPYYNPGGGNGSSNGSGYGAAPAQGVPSYMGPTSAAPDKSCRLMIRESGERAIAVVSATHALIFRHSSTTADAIADGSLPAVVSGLGGGGGAAASKCMVRLVPLRAQPLEGFRSLTPRPIYGTLGLISLGREVFLCAVTQATRVATLRPGETVEKILNVEFYCLNHAGYDDIFSVAGPGGQMADRYSDSVDYSSDHMAYGGGPGAAARREGVPVEQHPCHELQKLLGNGSFYFSTDFDMTNRLQDRPVEATTFDIDNFDDSFLWNSFMIGPLLQFRSRLPAHEREALDASRILTSAIRGFCLTVTIPQVAAPLRAARSGLPSFLTVISRLSCRRAGTRFNARGIDDEGNVANFVETETIYWSPSGILFSYAQIRGSVPVFWEQSAGLIPGQQKITITRSKEGTQHAFDKHFDHLEQTYGAVHVVNLLSDDKQGERELTELFQYGINHCALATGRQGDRHGQDHSLLRMTHYDFHAETKGAQGYEAAREIRRYIEDWADGFAYFLAEEIDDAAEVGQGQGHGQEKSVHGQRRFVVVLQQEGVFRTNCLDCLDRTNLIQTLVSQMAVESFLRHKGEHATSDFWMRHSSLWADNGDNLSKIYAGTGALKSSFTRHGKMSLAGAIADARKSATRLYINNFADKGRQTTIDMLLGRLMGQTQVVLFDPISDVVAAELARRSAEFSTSEPINIWVGTFNLNGRTDGLDEDLRPWICPPALGDAQPEIFAVGFQEIVELNPQQIMSSDPARKKEWELAIQRTLNSRPGEKYVLLRSGQLVGAALCIFVRASCLPKIKNVEGSVKKTGLSGIAGNKGAVAIRLDYAGTQICFVTAHLAAGFANYDERNKDYATIHHGLRFQRNRGIDDHDTVIWLGDFNYRIGLTHEVAMELVKRRDLGRLYENDQLNLQMVAGLAFPYYSEHRITFMPTYKLDIGTDSYDSSEKARIPAWTDRILRKGTNLRQLSYDSAPLRFSDHRPVYATFKCIVAVVDEAVRDRISREIYERQKDAVGGPTAAVLGRDDDDVDDEEMMGYDAIEPGLPPASSDRQKWWLDNGKMARSTVGPPKALAESRDSISTVLNPARPSNPFHPTDEPDWVAVPRTASRVSSFSTLSTSPWEHINESHIHAAGTKPPPRKLPPPFDPSSTLPASVGRHPAAASADAANLASKDGPPPTRQQDSPPPRPPPRRQTAAAQPLAPPQADGPATSRSTTPTRSPSARSLRPTAVLSSSAASASPQHQQQHQQQPAKKPAAKQPPPVARKPAHLAGAASSSPGSSPTLSHSSLSEAASATASGFATPLPLRPAAPPPSSSAASTRSATTSSAPDARPPPVGGLDAPAASAIATAIALRKQQGLLGQQQSQPPSYRQQSPPGPNTLRKAATSTSMANGSTPPGRATPPAGAVGLPGMIPGLVAAAARDAAAPAPRLPTRPTAGPLQQQQQQPATLKKRVPAPTNLLDDDPTIEMGSWETLAPTTASSTQAQRLASQQQPRMGASS